MQRHFQYFATPVTEFELPTKFTFPFYYEPHTLCLIAAKEIQEYLNNQVDFVHDFGFDTNKEKSAIGKMFGVLVVKNEQGELGYIAAVSGTLAKSNVHKKFVPPIYDMLTKDSHYLRGNIVLNQITVALEEIEKNTEYLGLLEECKSLTEKSVLDIQEKKQALRTSKKNRNLRRAEAKSKLSVQEYQGLEEALGKESLEAKYFFNNVNRYWQHTLNPIEEKLAVFKDEIAKLKEQRRTKSVGLQQYIYDQYQFLNVNKEIKKLPELFDEKSIQNLPAGTGECAAPKLLQYAFVNNLKPIAMAEFWWGKSPNKEIRKHKYFYPACQGRCKPILKHMLDGMDIDTNPLLENPAIGKELETIFEDEELIVIYKPAEFLSVPGIHIEDSVYTRMKQQVENISGPIIVHRLDMSTSGLLVIAKNKESHKLLQKQFIERTVKKRYTALLDGILTEQNGSINLPLRADYNDRPRQLVCYDYGKPATTNWELIKHKNGRSKVHFYPVSGRTHQLRIHASHALGLNTPIVGDDLYGKKSSRLFLHADTLSFLHPTNKERMTFHKEADF